MTDQIVNIVGNPILGRLEVQIREQQDEIEHLRDERNEWCRRYKKAKAELKQAKAKCEDREILRAFYEAVCDDNWEVANGIRSALSPVAALETENEHNPIQADGLPIVLDDNI